MNHSHMNGSQPYSAVVTDHFSRPRHVGKLTVDHEALISGTAGRREQGIEVVFHIGIDGTRIAEMTFEAFGCPHTIAACSVLAERLTGRPVEALGDFQPAELAGCLGLPVEKTGRLLVIEDALRKCREAWDNRRLGQS